MTRIGVLADSHRALTKLRAALGDLADCDLIVHLGDHEADMENMGVEAGRLLTVPGNCDLFSMNPGSRVFERDGVKVFMTHGNAYGVKYTLLRLALKAKELNAGLALFGHSHSRAADRDGEVLCLNPGALKDGSYAVVTLDKGEITYEFRSL